MSDAGDLDLPILDLKPDWNDFRKIRHLRAFLKRVVSKPPENPKQDFLQKVYYAEDTERFLTYRYDFKAFCLEIMDAEIQGDAPCRWSQVHYNLCRFLRSCLNRGDNAFVMVPRNHLKTHICTIYWRIWRLLNDPNMSALVVSGTLSLSKAAITAIKGILMTNEKIHRYWPHVVQKKLWTDKMNKWSETAFDVIRFRKNPQNTVEAVGVGATVAGKHFWEINFDDLVTTENSTTPDQCQKVIDYYRYYLSVSVPGHQRRRMPKLVVGTPYTDNDLYTFLRQPDIIRQFKFFIQPIYDTNGKIIWNPPFTPQVVEEILKAQGTYIFSCQYLLDPVPSELQEFRREWIHTYKNLPLDLNGNEIYLEKYVLVDAITFKDTDSQSKDRGVILVVGVDRAGIWYVIDYQLFPRAKEGEMFKGIFEMCEKHGVYRVGWEMVAYQSQGKYNLEEEIKRRKLKLTVKELRTRNRDKDVRIRALIPYFERGQVYIKYWMTELILELTRFPKGQTKDIIDALAYMLDLIPQKRSLTTGQRMWLNQSNQGGGLPFYR